MPIFADPFAVQQAHANALAALNESISDVNRFLNGDMSLADLDALTNQLDTAMQKVKELA